MEMFGRKLAKSPIEILTLNKTLHFDNGGFRKIESQIISCEIVKIAQRKSRGTA